MSASETTTKKALRQNALAQRAALPPAARKAAAESVAERLAGLLGDVRGRVVAGYWPIRGELDCGPALTRAAAAGARTALAVTLDRAAPLAFRPWRPGEPLGEDVFGIPAPPEEAGRAEPDIVLVPLLAFDEGRHRLGYGAGLYDRTLEALKAARPVRAIGLAFAAQKVDSLPADPYDHRLDLIVTEAGVVAPREGRT